MLRPGSEKFPSVSSLPLRTRAHFHVQAADSRRLDFRVVQAAQPLPQNDQVSDFRIFTVCMSSEGMTINRPES